MKKYFVLRETEGKTSELKLASGVTGKSLLIKELDVIGNEISKGSLEIKPLESKFYRIDLN